MVLLGDLGPGGLDFDWIRGNERDCYLMVPKPPGHKPPINHYLEVQDT